MTKKIQYPDGEGGWENIEAEEITTKMDQKKVEKRFKQEGNAEKVFFEKAEAFALALDSFGKKYAFEQGLTKEEAASGIYLENINVRENWSEGKEDYDNLCNLIWTWYKNNLE